jgi:FtsZ-binding cell division protein ZapB
LDQEVETNKGNIKAIKDEIGTKPADSSTIWGAIKSIVGDSSQSLSALDSKIDEVKEDLESETEGRTSADNALSNRIKNLEDNNAGYATTTQVAAAKKEAIDAAAADATTKANAAQAAAEKYTNDEIKKEADARKTADNAINDRITALVGDSENEGKTIY